MGNKSNKLNLLLSIILAFTLIYGLSGYAHAKQLDSVEIAGITAKLTNEILPWGVDRIAADVVRDQNRGQGVKVAILDTGIDLNHPDLRVAGDVSFVEGTASGDDDNGHGTLVAGIVAALNNGIGTVGVAPEVELYSVKVLDDKGQGTCKAIKKGIEWAIENNIQVINMSFGCNSKLPRSIKKSLRKAYKEGILIVAAAGNEGTAGGNRDTLWAPAEYKQVIAVGAINEYDKRYGSSSTGYALELVAPGVRIYSTRWGGGYTSLYATSAASPHVAGVAALLLAAGINDNAEVRKILQDTAEDLGTSGWDSQYGYGLVNAAEALAVASSYTNNSDNEECE